LSTTLLIVLRPTIKLWLYSQWYVWSSLRSLFSSFSAVRVAHDGSCFSRLRSPLVFRLFRLPECLWAWVLPSDSDMEREERPDCSSGPLAVGSLDAGGTETTVEEEKKNSPLSYAL
jgi:hypothetical protein